MTFTIRFAASAIIFLASVSALPAEPTVEIRQPIGQLSADELATVFHGIKAQTPEHVTLSPGSFIGNATEATPSASITDAVNKRLIGGSDTRVLYSGTDFPYGAIGRLIWSSGVYCSASLIGPRHIAAARHCIPLDGQQVTLTFQPAYFNGNRFPSSTVTTVVYIPKGDSTGDCDVREDWGLFILADRRQVGDQHGYLGAKVIDQGSQLNTPIFTTFGYPGDLGGGSTSYRETGISVSSANGCNDPGGPLYTNADSAGGQSGSSLFDSQAYSYGTLSVGVFVNNVLIRTEFAAGENFVNGVISVRNSFP